MLAVCALRPLSWTGVLFTQNTSISKEMGSESELSTFKYFWCCMLFAEKRLHHIVCVGET